MVRFMVAGLSGLILFISASAAGAASLSVPDCGALLKWAQGYDKSKTKEITRRVQLANIFFDDVSSKVFGRRALDWDRDDHREVSKGIRGCERQFRKKRDRASFKTLATARSLIGRSLRGAQNHYARLDRSINQARARLLEAPVRPNTYLNLSAYDTAEELNRRFRLNSVPKEHVAALVKEVVDFRAKLRKEAVDKAGKAIEGLPEESASLIASMKEVNQVKATYDDTPERTDIAALEKAAALRRKAIREKLAARQGDAKPMIFPECSALLAWSGKINFQQPIQTPSGLLYRALLDDRLVPVFGKSLDKWSDADFAVFRDGAQVCANPPLSAAQMASTRGQRPQMSAAARNALSISGSVQRMGTAVASYREGKEAVAKTQEKLASVQPTVEGLQQLNQMRRDPSLNKLTYQERNRQVKLIQMRQRQIAAKLVADETKKLDSFPGGLEGLEKIGRYREKVLRSYRYYAAPQTITAFDSAFRKRDAELTQAALPEFQKKLAALPATKAGIESAQKLADAIFETRYLESQWHSPRLTFGPSGRQSSRRRSGKLPEYMASYREATEKRKKEIETALFRAECKKVYAEVKLSSGAVKQEVMGAVGPTTIGEMVCRMVKTGHKFHSYQAPGLVFGGNDYTIKVTAEPAGYQTIKLHMAEVGPDKKMLVGYQVADANTKKDLTVQQWQAYAALLTGQTMQAGMKMLQNLFQGAAQQMRQMKQNPR